MALKILDDIKSGPQHKPPFILLNGRPGVGKSTMLAALYAVLILDYDNGLSEIDCQSVDMASRSFEDLLALIKELAELYDQDPENFPYKWVAIDSADKLEQIIQQAVCNDHGWSSIEEPGYGKGYSYAAEKGSKFIRFMKRLQQKTGVGVMIACHATIKTVNEPHIGEPYDLYTSKLHKRFAADLYEAADAILFGAMKSVVKKKNHEFGRQVTQNVVSNERVLYTTPSTGIEAKNRYGLPDRIPMDAQNLLKLIEEGRQSNAKTQ